MLGVTARAPELETALHQAYEAMRKNRIRGRTLPQRYCSKSTEEELIQINWYDDLLPIHRGQTQS